MEDPDLLAALAASLADFVSFEEINTRETEDALAASLADFASSEEIETREIEDAQLEEALAASLVAARRAPTRHVTLFFDVTVIGSILGRGFVHAIEIARVIGRGVRITVQTRNAEGSGIKITADNEEALEQAADAVEARYVQVTNLSRTRAGALAPPAVIRGPLGPSQYRHVFIDNSNMYLSALSSFDGRMNPAVRINVHSFVNLLENGNSDPPAAPAPAPAATPTPAPAVIPVPPVQAPGGQESFESMLVTLLEGNNGELRKNLVAPKWLARFGSPFRPTEFGHPGLTSLIDLHNHRFVSVGTGHDIIVRLRNNPPAAAPAPAGIPAPPVQAPGGQEGFESMFVTLLEGNNGELRKNLVAPEWRARFGSLFRPTDFGQPSLNILIDLHNHRFVSVGTGHDMIVRLRNNPPAVAPAPAAAPATIAAPVAAQLVQTRYVAGSKPPAQNSVWQRFRDERYVASIHSRDHQTGRETAIDTVLHGAALQLVMDRATDPPGANTLVLATGDGNVNDGFTSFPRLAQSAAAHGFRVEIWSFQASLSRNFRAVAAQFPDGRITIHLLDPHALRILYVQTTREERGRARRVAENEVAVANVDGGAAAVRAAAAAFEVEASEAAAAVVAEVEGEPAPQAADSPDGDNFLCVICYDAQRDTIILPCGHLIACATCCALPVFSRNGCPACRQPITGTQRVFV
jgi:hypothetical protein